MMCSQERVRDRSESGLGACLAGGDRVRGLTGGAVTAYGGHVQIFLRDGRRVKNHLRIEQLRAQNLPKTVQTNLEINHKTKP
jgi:hypothetical protein